MHPDLARVIFHHNCPSELHKCGKIEQEKVLYSYRMTFVFFYFFAKKGVKKWPYKRKFSTLYNIVTLFNICHKTCVQQCSIMMPNDSIPFDQKILFCSSSCSYKLRGKDIQYHSKVFDARYMRCKQCNLHFHQNKAFMIIFLHFLMLIYTHVLS